MLSGRHKLTSICVTIHSSLTGKENGEHETRKFPASKEIHQICWPRAGVEQQAARAPLKQRIWNVHDPASSKQRFRVKLHFLLSLRANGEGQRWVGFSLVWRLYSGQVCITLKAKALVSQCLQLATSSFLFDVAEESTGRDRRQWWRSRCGKS